MLNNRKRIKAADIEESRFYQLPKWLIHDEAFKKLGAEAKILYTIMRDRNDLSLKNNWVDEEGYVYIIYSRKHMMEDVCLSDKSITKAVKELKAHGLIDEVRIGNNKPNHIYVLTVDFDSQWNRKNYDTGIVKTTTPDTEILRQNDTDSNETDLKETNNTTGPINTPQKPVALKSAVVSPQEEIIVKETNIKELSKCQKEEVSAWDIQRLIKAIQIYKELGGLYFKLLKKIYKDGAKSSLTRGKIEANKGIYTHDWDFDELEHLQRERIRQIIKKE